MKAITSNKWVLVLVLFLVLTNLALVFFAFKGTAKVEKKEEKGFLTSKLNLTEEQDKEFKKRKEEYFTLMKPRWEEVNTLKDSLYSHLGDEEVSDSVINYYVDQWSENSRESDKLLFKHFREIRKICTKEQQVIFDTIVPKMVKFQRKK